MYVCVLIVCLHRHMFTSHFCISVCVIHGVFYGAAKTLSQQTTQNVTVLSITNVWFCFTSCTVCKRKKQCVCKKKKQSVWNQIQTKTQKHEKVRILVLNMFCLNLIFSSDVLIACLWLRRVCAQQ